jgi:hypothetical protein
VCDPPPAVRATGVPVLVERRAFDHEAVGGGDHRVLEAPGAGGGVAVDVDLRLGGEVLGDDVRPQVLAHEADDLVPAGQVQRLAHGRGAVGGGGLRGERAGQVVPQLEIHAAQVAVLQPADVFQRDQVGQRGPGRLHSFSHGLSFPGRLTLRKNMF